MAFLQNELEALAELKEKLIRGYSLLEFSIFGSKASGTDELDSDIDVMIVLNQSSPVVESQIDDIIFGINIKYDCLITALYFSREELEQGPFSESPIYKRASQEGISF